MNYGNNEMRIFFIYDGDTVVVLFNGFKKKTQKTPDREIKKAIKLKLLDARKNARLTQEELARRIGANKSYISRVERGLLTPTVATLYKIAAAMGLTVELRPI